ncbi:HNH endonuclease signature motif containing protein [Verrucomicrobiaceae bacterium 227]
MKFTLLHKLHFGSVDGAYSEVTPREFKDSQITLDDTETAIVRQCFGIENIHRGNVKSNPAAASQQFIITGQGQDEEVSLNLVYPKPERDELRLYLRSSTFKPAPNEIWFLFAKDGRVHIGSKNLEAWRSIGRNDPDDLIYQSIITSSDNDFLPPVYREVASRLALKRDPRLALQRFQLQNHQCHIDSSCRYFTSRSSNLNYLEAHHFIPLEYQPYFPQSLDIIENIVALCPFCHRAFHHAKEDFTRDLISQIIPQHGGLLEKFSLDHEDVLSLYNCEQFKARLA